MILEVKMNLLKHSSINLEVKMNYSTMILDLTMDTQILEIKMNLWSFSKSKDEPVELFKNDSRSKEEHVEVFNNDSRSKDEPVELFNNVSRSKD